MKRYEENIKLQIFALHIHFYAYRLNAVSSAEYTRQRSVILSDRRKSQIFGGSRRNFVPICCSRSISAKILQLRWRSTQNDWLALQNPAIFLIRDYSRRSHLASSLSCRLSKIKFKIIPAGDTISLHSSLFTFLWNDSLQRIVKSEKRRVQKKRQPSVESCRFFCVI